LGHRNGPVTGGRPEKIGGKTAPGRAGEQMERGDTKEEIWRPKMGELLQLIKNEKEDQ